MNRSTLRLHRRLLSGLAACLLALAAPALFAQTPAPASAPCLL